MRAYLRKARKAKNMTQSRLADLVGLKRPQISLLETGRRGGSVDAWDRLEEALGVPAKQLRTIVKETS
jgi:transcriptional regulator with XRE-family HTH domain